MPVGNPINLAYKAAGPSVSAFGEVCDWAAVITPGGVAAADAATLTDPTGQITASTRLPFRREERRGQFFALSLVRDAALLVTQYPRVHVFGCTGGGRWQRLANLNGDISVQLSGADTDVVTAPGLLRTTVDARAHIFDWMGCDEALIGVDQALVGSTGTTATATVEAKAV